MTRSHASAPLISAGADQKSLARSPAAARFRTVDRGFDFPASESGPTERSGISPRGMSDISPELQFHVDTNGTISAQKADGKRQRGGSAELE